MSFVSFLLQTLWVCCGKTEESSVVQYCDTVYESQPMRLVIVMPVVRKIKKEEPTCWSISRTSTVYTSTVSRIIPYIQHGTSTRTRTRTSTVLVYDSIFLVRLSCVALRCTKQDLTGAKKRTRLTWLTEAAVKRKENGQSLTVENENEWKSSRATSLRGAAQEIACAFFFAQSTMWKYCVRRTDGHLTYKRTDVRAHRYISLETWTRKLIPHGMSQKDSFMP